MSAPASPKPPAPSASADKPAAFAADRHALLALLRARSLRRGDFVLSSGRRSSYYIDARITTMSGAGQVLIGRMALALFDDHGWKPALVGGLTLGADPVAYAIAHTATLQGRSLDAFTVRKEAKAHGAGRRIEGPFQSGVPVVVIEDVITTGESALNAAAVIHEAGGAIVGVFAIVDREEGGRERIAAAGYPVSTITTTSELLAD
jgi:orotate phosphoribosyltransferase